MEKQKTIEFTTDQLEFIKEILNDVYKINEI